MDSLKRCDQERHEREEEDKSLHDRVSKCVSDMKDQVIADKRFQIGILVGVVVNVVLQLLK
jgi:hypothetical protein